MPPKKPPLTAAQLEEIGEGQATGSKELHIAETEANKKNRLLEETTRIRAIYFVESEQERSARLEQQRDSREISRRLESEVEREEILLSVRLRNRVRLENETAKEAIARRIQIIEQKANRAVHRTAEEADARRRNHAEAMAQWREMENSDEVEERCRENCERTLRERERLRLQQEEMNDLQRAIEAINHADIVPVVPAEELEVLVDRRSLTRTHFLARKAIINENVVVLHDWGRMDVICKECDAKHFNAERPPDGKFTDCCLKGKVILPPPKDCPEILYRLMTDSHPKSKHFMLKKMDTIQRLIAPNW